MPDGPTGDEPDAAQTPIADAAQGDGASAIDGAPAVDAPLDAVPCVPGPDGEQCNGVDDDCDGMTDEGFPGVGGDCDVGVGGCERTGTLVCTPDGTSTACSVMPGAPATELCGTGIDEDCDGMTDEGFPTLGNPCTSGMGVCTAAGTFTCAMDGLSLVCNATSGAPGTELCGNSLDDDCDGMTDEGFGVGAACTVGVGACARSGNTICAPGGMSTTCNVTPGPVATETCNGIDDDCDGTTDEGLGVGGACDGVDSDLCAEGVTICTAFGGTTCNDSTGNNVELCNGVDDDCNPGTADGSGDPSVGSACDGPDGDLCNEGTRSCSGGALSCSDMTTGQLELCNGGFDDDCNPGTAEGSGDPALGAPCDGGDTDACNEGATYCTPAGAVSCNDTTGSATEICGNMVDDDCIGGADNGCAPPGCSHSTCATGGALVTGCSTCVTTVCGYDPYCCTTAWDTACAEEAQLSCGGCCTHSACTVGAALTSGCTPCVAQICAADSYCCSGSWDSICQGEVASICGLTCP